MKRTAAEIINEIASFYGFTKDRQVAVKLGVSAAVVANWKRRDSIDIFLIAENCPDIDINKLLRGRPIEETSSGISQTSDLQNKEEIQAEYTPFHNSDVFQIIKDKDRTIINLAKQLGEVESKYKTLKKQNDQEKH